MPNLPHGIYDALLHEELGLILQQHRELRSVFGKLDPEEEPSRYAAFLAKVLEKALRLENDPATRLRLCNEIVERIACNPTTQFLQGSRLILTDKPILLEITPPNYAHAGMLRPETTLAESSLFTGSPADPQLVHELAREMRSADAVDLLDQIDVRAESLELPRSRYVPAIAQLDITRGGSLTIPAQNEAPPAPPRELNPEVLEFLPTVRTALLEYQASQGQCPAPVVPPSVGTTDLWAYFLKHRDQILRDKWCDSQKAGYDIGLDRALRDWLQKHPAYWAADETD